MESREKSRERLLHPLFVLLPLGFALAALAADVLGFAYQIVDAWAAAHYLALGAIGAGAAAGVPALIDVTRALAAETSVKRLAILHGVLNGSAIVLLLASWLSRGAPGSAPAWTVVALEGAAALALVYGGLIGHTVLEGRESRRRYAALAGHGRFVDLQSSDKPVRVAAIDELKINQMRLVRLGDRRIVIARTDRGVCAFEDNCSHQGGSLAEGVMLACTVLCPWHGSTFDALTGRVKSGPARRPLRIYRVELRGGDVYLHPQALPEIAEVPRAANI